MNGLRIAAWIFVAMALVLVGADIISSLEAGGPVVRTTREILNLAPGVALEPLGTEGAGGVVNLVLDVPLWAIVGVIGIVLTLLLRPVE